jgi:hypothetical protein
MDPTFTVSIVAMAHIDGSSDGSRPMQSGDLLIACRAAPAQRTDQRRTADAISTGRMFCIRGERGAARIASR